MNDFQYVGSELDLFAAVHNWKSYWSEQLRPYVTGDVLEVGAGIGSNTSYLIRDDVRRWVCLEPDAALAERLRATLGNTDRRCDVVCGTVADVRGAPFDTLLYIDVLEHIEEDRQELENAAKLLREGGRIVVLSPAHQWLFTPFDAAIGHYRRYNRSMLRALTPATMQLERDWYLDSAGLLLSAANRCLLRQSMPTKTQLHFWDRYVVPVSRVVDPCSFGRAGKSIVAVWRKP